MYSVGVSDHMMVAHSLPRESFGPAQNMHGATYVVDVSFQRRELDADNVVIDIGRATQELSATLDTLRYRNLDEHPDFAGQLTTTEFLARYIADRLAATGVVDGLAGMEVTLRETPNAWASYRVDFEATR
ncbi:6-pyruvoyl trahydropterin synthase family protein [Arthrobacter castelli]|uniref:6-pyruvoyl trahydropterin synthase family protein n=1 Tax=Arthrobacter castelli TaxID=271431 RepID=UPI000413025D|nr:6-carboxytetrahydropterin synthase [Arthrobacter castelli]